MPGAGAGWRIDLPPWKMSLRVTLRCMHNALQSSPDLFQACSLSMGARPDTVYLNIGRACMRLPFTAVCLCECVFCCPFIRPVSTAGMLAAGCVIIRALQLYSSIFLCVYN